MSRPLRSDEAEFLWKLLEEGYRQEHNGYIYIISKKKKYKRSRILYQLRNNLFIYPEEIVHHKDKDRTNDHYTNLELMTNYEHNSHHNKDMKGIKHLKRFR